MSKQRACLTVLSLICCAAFTNSAICEVEDIDLDYASIYNPHENPTVIRDDYKGIVETLNTTNVTSVSVEDVKYLDVSFKDNKLSVSTTPEFKNYDVNERKDNFIIKIFLNCSNGVKNRSYEFYYQQYVEDTNNYAPVFDRESYTYEFYGEFDEEFEVTSMMPITATDLDLSTREIYFSIEETPDFDFYSSTKDKIGQFELYTNGYLSPTYEKTFTLTATDDFKGEKRSTKTTLTIILHKPEPTDTKLSFAKPQYEATIKNNTFEVTEIITLVDGIDDCAQLKVISDYSEFFKASVDHLRNGVRLELVKPIPMPRSYKSIDITIEATWKSLVATSTVKVSSDNPMALLCKLGDVDLTERFYRNPEDINDTHEGTVQVIDKTLNINGVTCSGSKYMKCSFNNGIVTVETTADFKNYERDEMDTIMAMNMTVKCPYEDVTLEYRQFVRDVNNHDPLFDKKQYTYVFYNQIPYEFSLTDIIPIRVEDIDLSNGGFIVSIEPRDEFYFDVDYGTHKKGANCQLYAESDVNPGFKKTYVLGVTDREQSGNTKRNSSARLTIEVKDEQLLKFTKPEYNSLILNESFTYNNDRIEIVGGFDQELRLNLRSEYLDYFEVKPDVTRGEILVSLLKPPGDIKELATRVKIEAEWRGFKAETVLNVFLNGELPSTLPPSTEVSPSTESGFTDAANATTTSSPDEAYGELSGFNNWVFASVLSQVIIISVSCVSLLAMIVVAYKYYFLRVGVVEKPNVEI